MKLPANDPAHGTVNGYKNHGCRCEQCCAANTEAHRDFMHRTGRARPWGEYLQERRGDA